MVPESYHVRGAASRLPPGAAPFQEDAPRREQKTSSHARILGAITVGTVFGTVGMGLVQTSGSGDGSRMPLAAPAQIEQIVSPATQPVLVAATQTQQNPAATTPTLPIGAAQAGNGVGQTQTTEERPHYVGALIADLTPEQTGTSQANFRQGVLIRNVYPSGPAAAAGIQPGDIFLAIDGAPLRRTVDVVARTQLTPIGQHYTVTLDRGGAIRNVPVRVARQTPEFLAWAQGQRPPQ